MDLKNIKNSTKESIIQNFMENVKHARRGASHQRPKSWSKGTKSGSDKKKMRREGKDAAREMNENKGTQGKEMMVGGGVGAIDKAVLDAAATFGSEGVHIPKLTPRVQEILKNEMQWRRNLDNQINSFSGARGLGQMTPEPMSESLYSRLKTKLQEQSPMGWHEGDPELESDVMAKHSASLSPEEQDPFHLIDADEREDIHATLQRPHGTSLVRAGLLGRIQTIASMAKDTQTGKDDPVAMQRISQLIDYGNKVIDQHMKDYMSSSSGQDIPR